MARGGIRLGPDGKPRQGRKPGSKDRATLEREIEALKIALAEAGEPNTGEKTDLDVLKEIRDYWLSVAETERKQERPKPAVIADAYDRAEAAAAKRAPYKHAQISRVTLRDDPLDLSRLNEKELAELERLGEKASAAGGYTGRTGATQH